LDLEALKEAVAVRAQEGLTGVKRGPTLPALPLHPLYVAFATGKIQVRVGAHTSKRVALCRC
jgi:hypothetical protein